MPLKLYNAATGAVVFDSDALTQGVCLGVLNFPAGVGGTKTYPNMVGCSLRVFYAGGRAIFRSSDVEVTYPGGVPTIRVPPNASGAVSLVVWCMGVPTVPPRVGIYHEALGGGNVAVTPDGAGFCYAGTATVVGSTPSWGTPRTDGQLGYHELVFDCAYDIIPVPVVTEGYEIACWNYWRESASRWRIQATRVLANDPDAEARWKPLVAPEIAVYTAPVSQPTPPYMAIWPADAPLSAPPSWDLMRPGLLYPYAMPVLLNREDSYPLPGGRWGVYGACDSIAVEYVGEPSSPDVEWYMAGRRYYRSMWTLYGGRLRGNLVCVDSSGPEQTPPWQTGIDFAEQSCLPLVINLTGL